MIGRQCPDCGLLMETGQDHCRCGYRIRTSAGWTEGLTELRTPKTPWVFVPVLLAVPGTLALFAFLAWLDWFHLEAVASILLLIAAAILPLMGQYLPTFRRKNGGCCFGCLLWFAIGAGTWWASTLWDFGDPVTERDAPPPPRLAQGPVQLDGVSLGDTLDTVRQRYPQAEKVDFPYAIGAADSYSLKAKDGTIITVFNDRVVRIEGSVLTQDNKTMLESGLAAKHFGYLFETSSFVAPRRKYSYSNAAYAFRPSKEGRIASLMTWREALSFLFGPSAETVDGYALHSRLKDVPSDLVVPNVLTRGETTIHFDATHRITQVQGNQLAQNGKVLLRAGDEAPQFLLDTSKRYGIFETFGGVQLQVSRDGSGKVAKIAIRPKP